MEKVLDPVAVQLSTSNPSPLLGPPAGRQRRMGVMQFQVPSGIATDDVDGLRRAYLAGGYDRCPVTTRAEVAGDRLLLHQEKDESGFLSVPWAIPGIGRVIGSTTTLMERPTPYRLLSELARGKVNQVRS